MLHLTGSFILTITRVSKEGEKEKYKKVHIKRKLNNPENKIAIYSFQSFDDFCEFCTYIDQTSLKKINKSIKKVSLFSYDSKYYLVLNNFVEDISVLKSFCSAISEFGTFVNNSDLFERKLNEYGNLIIKNNAISTCIKYFCC